MFIVGCALIVASWFASLGFGDYRTAYVLVSFGFGMLIWAKGRPESKVDGS